MTRSPGGSLPPADVLSAGTKWWETQHPRPGLSPSQPTQHPLLGQLVHSRFITNMRDAGHAGHALPCLPHPRLVQPLVIDAEVVAEFVQHRLAHLFPDLVIVGADRLDVLLVDADLVRRHQVV